MTKELQIYNNNSIDKIFILIEGLLFSSNEMTKLIKYSDKSFDWDSIFDLSEIHNLLPLIYKSIEKNFPEKIDIIINETIKSNYRNSFMLNHLITAELIKILRIFKNNNIRAIPVKGVAIAKQIYNNISMRTMNDIDLFVHVDDVRRVRDLLISEGYRVTKDIAGNDFDKYIDYYYELGFFVPNSNIYIEIGWKATENYLSLPLHFNSIWDDKSSFIELDERINCISPEDHFIYLCFHLIKHSLHGDLPLSLICDLAGLLKLISYKRLFVKSINLRCQKVILVFLQIIKDLYHYEYPDHVVNQINNKAISDLSREYLSLAFSLYKRTVIINKYKIAYVYTKMREHLLDKLAFPYWMIKFQLYALGKNPFVSKSDWISFGRKKRLKIIYYKIRDIVYNVVLFGKCLISR